MHWVFNHSTEDLILALQVGQLQGETIFKGHRSYDLMLNLQLGIRHSVGSITAGPVGLVKSLSDWHFVEMVHLLHCFCQGGQCF